MKITKRLTLTILSVLIFLVPCFSIEDGGGQTTTFILVRHAEKVKDGSSDPPLTDEGKARAEDLASMLHFIPLEAVYSTPYIRTRETARPVAESKKLNILSYKPGNDEEFLAKLLNKFAGKTVLIVGHSNTIPGMVNTLTEREIFSGLDDSTYDNIFIVTVSAKRNATVLRLRFGAFTPGK